MTPLHVYIGYDDPQTLAYHVLAHSIIRRASRPVCVAPVARHMLKGVYPRPRELGASTDFSDTRFLVPIMQRMCGGWAVFMDCDGLMRSDITELAKLCTNQYALRVRKRADGEQGPATKFYGSAQTSYPRKNWSSFMMMNLDYHHWAHPTPNEVVRKPIPSLHRFETYPDNLIGDIPAGYNHLVGIDAPNPAAKHVHFTLGGPWAGDEYMDVEFADEWRAELKHMMGQR